MYPEVNSLCVSLYLANALPLYYFSKKNKSKEKIEMKEKNSSILRKTQLSMFLPARCHRNSMKNTIFSCIPLIIRFFVDAVARFAVAIASLALFFISI